MKLVLFLSLFIVPSLTWARVCQDVDGGALYNLSSQVSTIVPQINLCKDLLLIKNQQDFKTLIKIEIDKQSQTLAGKPSDRHSVGAQMNNCTPQADSTTLIINFQGTGGFEPRVSEILEKLIKCPEASTLSPELKVQAHYLVLSEYKKKISSEAKWSALDAGPMTQLLSDPDLHKRAANYDFMTFPSEESELIANPKKITASTLSHLPSEIKKSMGSQPIGIKNALACVQTYFKKAKEMGIKPKMVVMSHSSGARSVVKFLEQLKSTSAKADLVFTIDPVKEAQHALQEVVSQQVGETTHKIIDALPFVNLEKRKPIRVWSRQQPESLYKTSNAKKWVNVYQMTDEEGMKMEPKFGIYGSPIHKADKNLFIKDGLESDAHGGIASHPDVKKLLKTSLLAL